MLNETILKKELPTAISSLEGIKKLGVLQSGGHEMFDHFAYLELEDATRPQFGADPVEYYNLISNILREKERTGCNHSPKGLNCGSSNNSNGTNSNEQQP